MDRNKPSGTAVVPVSPARERALALARKVGVSGHTGTALAPASDAAAMRQVGKVTSLTTSPDTPFGRWLTASVEALRRLPTANRAADYPLTFRGYCEAVKHHKEITRALGNERRAIAQGNWAPDVPYDTPEMRHFVEEIYDPEVEAPEFWQYVTYVCRLDAKLARLIEAKWSASSVELLEADRRMHSYVVGGSGSGKSELLKQLIHHYVVHRELGSVVVLDPHGKLVREVARWREFAGTGTSRLVYLDATAARDMQGLVPALNPMSLAQTVPDLDRPDLADQLADALAYLAGDGEAQTHYMNRLASFCLEVMFEHPGCTLYDLKNSLERGDGAPLLAWGKKSPRRSVREHFENQFESDSYKAARRGLASRIEGVLKIPRFEAMMVAPNPVDLEGEIDKGKVILVNCGSVGTKARVALGRLIMARVAAMGMRREDEEGVQHRQVHLFIDEAAVLMAPTVFIMLKELRKRGVALTMAQQTFGDGMAREEVKILMDSTKIKMFGRTDDAAANMKRMNWDGDLPKVADRQFLVSTGSDRERVMLDTAPNLVNDTNAMSPDDWQTLLKAQFAAYYRRPGANEDATADAPARKTWKHS